MSENQTQETMTEKLQNAAAKAETQKKERTERTKKGAHLLTAMLDLVKAEGLETVEKTAFLQVRAPGTKGRVLYIDRKGGRVDLSGFSLEHAAITQISAEDAKAKHLGKVRGMVNFESADSDVMAAFTAALTELKSAPPADPPKPPKAEKTEASTEPVAPRETPPEQA